MSERLCFLAFLQKVSDRQGLQFFMKLQRRMKDFRREVVGFKRPGGRRAQPMRGLDKAALVLQPQAVSNGLQTAFPLTKQFVEINWEDIFCFVVEHMALSCYPVLHPEIFIMIRFYVLVIQPIPKIDRFEVLSKIVMNWASHIAVLNFSISFVFIKRLHF